MNEDLTNKDMVIYDNSPKDIMKDYLKVSLYSKSIKFEEKECVNELQVDFIEMKSITLNMNFSLACTHHKLNYEVHKSKTCYFINMLAIMLYSKYLFLWSERVRFLIDSSRVSFSEVYR
jgi:CRISPR/Cas system CMR-associated protein Cmr3 (group 5 of RAMP superfamily)